MNLYITADRVGEQTGGGLVTLNEYTALSSLGDTTCLSGDKVDLPDSPFDQDKVFLARAHDVISTVNEIPIAHCYSGCLSSTVDHLKDFGAKVTYTCAAHSVAESRKEHEDLGLPFSYPHLTDPDLWRKYLHGYLAADVLICPSQAAASICREQGRTGRIEVIPHGCHLPVKVPPMPGKFTVGYMGAIGPDKGLVHLLKAWKFLKDRPEAKWNEMLVLAGRHSTSPYVQHLISQVGVTGVHCMGWVNDIADFYERVMCYVQPSVSEGFGLEVLEAMAHGRYVLCSYGAGAHDLVPEGCKFPIRDHESLAASLYYLRQDYFQKERGQALLKKGLETAKAHTWDKIQEKYQTVWRSLIG